LYKLGHFESEAKLLRYMSIVWDLNDKNCMNDIRIIKFILCRRKKRCLLWSNLHQKACYQSSGDAYSRLFAQREIDKSELFDLVALQILWRQFHRISNLVVMASWMCWSEISNLRKYPSGHSEIDREVQHLDCPIWVHEKQSHQSSIPHLASG